MKLKISAVITAAIIILFSFSAFAEDKTEINEPNIKTDLSENEANTSTPSDTDESEETNDDKEPPKDEGQDNDESDDNIKKYEFFLNGAESASDVFNVQSYTVLDEEKYNMYGAERIMRRDGAIGEAWAIFEIPYISEIFASSCHLPLDAASMSFELSKDGVTWNEADLTVTVTEDENRWMRIDYSAENISGIKYVKVIWGEEANLQNWWNPYFLGLYANTEEPRETEIVIDGKDELYIPIYEPCEYTLSGRVLDQIGNDTDAAVTWVCDSESVEVSADGKVIISPDMTVGDTFTVRAESGDLFAEKSFTLCASMPADTDGDNIITQKDIDFIIENYGRTADEGNRLCDADKNGVIDIIDLAYAARYMISTED